MTKPRTSTGGAYTKRGQHFIRVTVAPQKRHGRLRVMRALTMAHGPH
jgi:hypothetical protein